MVRFRHQVVCRCRCLSLKLVQEIAHHYGHTRVGLNVLIRYTRTQAVVFGRGGWLRSWHIATRMYLDCSDQHDNHHIHKCADQELPSSDLVTYSTTRAWMGASACVCSMLNPTSPFAKTDRALIDVSPSRNL